MHDEHDCRSATQTALSGHSLAPCQRSSEIFSVVIDSLLPAQSPRLAGEDEEHARRLAETEAALPPILVHRSTMRVIDGMHRLRAARYNGREKIDVRFFDGSEDEAFIQGVEENIAHGLPLSLADRKAAAERIMKLRPELSDRAIASRTGLAAKTVSTIRRRSSEHLPQSNVRVGADGRLRPLSGSEGRRRASEMIAARPDASLREIAKAAGVSVGTAHDVRGRMHRGEDPVPARSRNSGRRGGLGSRPDPTAGARPASVPAAGSGPDQGQVPEPCSGTAPEKAGSAPESDRPAHPARNLVRRNHNHTGPSNGPILLRNLIKDPSLRHTDLGRKLLRLLHMHIVVTAEWSGMVDAIPAHCTDTVAELARQCTDIWGRLASDLERRGGPSR